MRQLQLVRTLLQRLGCTGAVICDLPEIRWLSSFSGSNGLVYVSETDAILLTDPRYEQQIVREVTSMRATCVRGDLFESLRQHIEVDSKDRVLLDPRAITLNSFNKLSESLNNVSEIVQREGWLAQCVAQKSISEIDAIRRAQAITDSVFAEILPTLRPGMTEVDLSAEIVYRHLRRGAERMSFDPIVASGPNGALPHARPGQRQFENGDLVVIDMGCVVDGYASDMTRTIAIGEPSQRARECYDAVQRAQSAAILAAKAGMRAADLHQVAQNVLDDAGIGHFFVHSLGHGVGLQIHEWPRVSGNSDDVLPEDAVITIEPGVYLPGQFGIRIEDMIVLRKHGVENLTASPRDLHVVD